jgi:diguanylate cyclase (GGDEF)-like protein
LAWLHRTTAQLETSQAQSGFLAFHDPLTGAANRALFEAKLAEALRYHSLAETKVALISIDLYNFMVLNDSLGHVAGDLLIQKVVDRLSYALPEEATLARLGGDEFALVQPGIVSEGHARWICQDLLSVFDDPFDLGGRRVAATASFGVALEQGDLITPEELLRRADLALYAAKANGRSRIEYYNDDLDRERRLRRSIEVDLRDALIAGKGLFLQYQPIFDAQTGSVAGAEALVRWSHPTLGLLSPDRFIDIAEQSGVISTLGLWVLEEACRVAAEIGLPSIAVNVSPLQFRSDTLHGDVMAVLARHGLAASRLELEITEGVLLQNSSLVGSTLRQLRDSGVRIALDDFGTGYASISYLRTYPVDKLKIDRSFVTLLCTDPAIRSIVRSIVEMGKALEMTITAEGVEDEDQQRVLTQLGCTYLQGYLLSRPVSSEQLEVLRGRVSPAVA